MSDKKRPTGSVEVKCNSVSATIGDDREFRHEVVQADASQPGTVRTATELSPRCRRRAECKEAAARWENGKDKFNLELNLSTLKHIQDLSLKDKSLYMYIMELISKQVHNTMLEFLATLNEDTLDGVFTARLTPIKFDQGSVEKKYRTEHYTEQVKYWLYSLCSEHCCGCEGVHPNGDVYDLESVCTCPDKDPNIKKVLCFREYGDKVGVHFHIRFVTTYKDRKSIADHIKNHFPIPKGTGKGNEAYSVRDCKTKDKTIWKNASYIAKGNDCVFKWGYTTLEVEWFCKHASKYQKMKGKMKWEQILLFNESALKRSLEEKCFTDVAVETICSWHKAKNLPVPQHYQFGKLMHNLSYKLNPKYRVGMLNTIKNVYRRKNKDLGYDGEIYMPPVEQLPDWLNYN